MSQQSPVFVHSLFRSGSTYIFDKFRRHGGYTCFQEPFNEALFRNRENPEVLLDPRQSARSHELLRHPSLERPYFQEFCDIGDAWKDTLSEEALYTDFFGEKSATSTEYISSLIDAAPERAFLQTCRATLRFDALRSAAGGVHVGLWRNPWDQWWSMRTAGYFDTVLKVALDGAVSSPTSESVLAFTGVTRSIGRGIEELFDYHGRRPSGAEQSYRTFFVVWALSRLHARQHANFEVSIDLLSKGGDYATVTSQQFETAGIDAPDLSDCASPQATFSKKEEAFFEKVESQVCDWISDFAPNEADQLSALMDETRANRNVSGRVSSLVVNARRAAVSLQDAAAEGAFRFSTELSQTQAALNDRDSKLEQLASLNETAVWLQGQVEHRDKVLQDTVDFAEKTRAEHEAKARDLQEQLAWLQGQVEHRDKVLQDTVDLANRTRKDLEERLFAQDEEKAVLAQERDQTEQDRARLLQERGLLIGELEQVRAENDQLSITSRSVDTLQHELNAIQNSTFWRLTKPLRHAVMIARVLKGRVRARMGPLISRFVPKRAGRTPVSGDVYLAHIVDPQRLSQWQSDLGVKNENE